MSVKSAVKHLLDEDNPLVLHRRRQMRRALTNPNPSFLCPNCIGGILFHDLGLQFRSPTVNLMLRQTDFVKLVLNLDEYLARELRFFPIPDAHFPCARLGDIVIHFTHYANEQEAARAWYQRAKRIDRNNLFVFLEERDGLSEREIRALADIQARGLVVFTANDYPDIPYAVRIPKYTPDGEVGNILKKSWLDGSREYEKYFDFVKWFNEAHGGDFSAAPFCR